MIYQEKLTHSRNSGVYAQRAIKNIYYKNSLKIFIYYIKSNIIYII